MMRGRRVVMLLRNPLTHDWRVEKEAAALVEDGHDVTVIALGAPGLPAHETRDGYQVRRISSFAPLRPPPDQPAWRRALKKVGSARRLFQQSALAVSAGRALRPDVVHAHDLPTLLPGWILARLCGAALIYDSHEIFLEQLGRSKDGLLKRWWRAYEAFLMRRVDAVITVNDSLADYFAETYGIARPHVVMNASDVPAEPLDGTVLRERAGVPESMRIVLYHGRIFRERGLPELIEAMREIPNAALIMLGDGPLRPELEALRDRLGLRDRVHFLEPVLPRDLLRFVAGADVGAVPIQGVSLNHRFATPNKLFECMAAGVPLAVSDLPEQGRIVRDHGLGALFDPDDPRDIARGIRAVLDDPDPAALRERVRRAAREHFSWARQRRELLDVYRTLPTR